MAKMLNIGYAIETINARLNGSSDEVEYRKDSFNNTTFTKKIGNRSMVSAVCQKSNMRRYMADHLGLESNIKTKDGKMVKHMPNPYKYLQDDVFGFMMAEKLKISEEEYEALDDAEKSLYKKVKSTYECNATKKRTSRLQMSSLVNVSNKRINVDFNICGTSGNSMPYKTESYAGIMYGIANFNIDKVGKFVVSNVESEFRDYNEVEGELLSIKDLDKEERVDRIEKTLRALEFLSISGNQTNHLTDTKPKFVIMGEYSWGNNVFQGIVKKDGLDVEMLKETLRQNEEFRLSDIWIGYNRFFDEDFNSSIEEIKAELSEFGFVNIDNVHNVFNSYIEHMKNTL